MKPKTMKVLLILFTVLGFLVLHFYIPRFITEIKNPVIRLIKKPLPKTMSFDRNKGKQIDFTSFDGTQLTSFLTYSTLDTAKGTIILLHGIRATKEHFIDLSNKLADLGYNSVALDSRAHGQSKGTHCTFGVKEKYDISALITLLNKQEQLTENIGIWGQSLGGAVGLQAMGIDKRIQFGIIESTFTDFKTITNDYFNYHAGFNIPLLTNYLVYRASAIANFNADEAKPLAYCQNITQPILIVHGNKDKRISIKYGKENFAKIASKEKKFVEIKNANHLNVWQTGGDDYFEKVMTFISGNTTR